MAGAALAFAALALAPARAQPQPRALPVDLELVLAVDVSGSVDADEARLQRQGYVDAFADSRVVQAVTAGTFGRIAVTYFEWAGDGWQKTVIGWTLIDGAAAARAFSARLADAPIGTGPWTSISGAIDFAVPLFGGGFEGTRRVIDLSGDGPNNTGRLAPLARDEAVKQRITINGLPIMNDRFDLSRPPMPNLDLYYRNCVIGGPGAFIVVARGFAAFAEAIRRKLVLEIAGTAPPDRKPGPTAGRYAQAGRPATAPDRRWVPPCDEGERRFRGVIMDE
jgi:hypothetical protein